MNKKELMEKLNEINEKECKRLDILINKCVDELSVLCYEYVEYAQRILIGIQDRIHSLEYDNYLKLH